MTVIDLFSGAGGFSLGAHQAGFKVGAAFDVDPILTSSFAYNFPDTPIHLADIASLKGKTISAIVKSPIQGIFGGPPCQGFSSIGKRLADDPRRELLGHFFRLVGELKPAFFVMENVRGLAYADARGVLDDALKPVRKEYALLGPIIWDVSEFGGATKRPRLFVIGIRKDCGEGLSEADVESFKRNPATVEAAIADLQDAIPVEEIDGFDVWRIARIGRPTNYAASLRSPDRTFTGQRATEHTKDVVRRFSKVLQGEMDVVGRHPRLAWDGQCPTLRAGTGADRGSYQSVRPLHPEENRVITVREAARLQGFPDNHRFHPTVWHSFRMIGNSVSPIMSHAIFSALRLKLDKSLSISAAAE